MDSTDLGPTSKVNLCIWVHRACPASPQKSVLGRETLARAPPEAGLLQRAGRRRGGKLRDPACGAGSASTGHVILGPALNSPELLSSPLNLVVNQMELGQCLSRKTIQVNGKNPAHVRPPGSASLQRASGISVVYKHCCDLKGQAVWETDVDDFSRSSQPCSPVNISRRLVGNGCSKGPGALMPEFGSWL